MTINDQRAANALYLALQESINELCLSSKTNQDLYIISFWLYRRMKKHYDTNTSLPWGHETHGGV